MLVTDAWCPYSCDEKSVGEGILVEVARKVFEKHGYNVKYRTMNWARAIQTVKDGKANGLVDAYKSDVPSFLFTNKPIMNSRMCFFTKEEDSWLYTGLPSLDDRKVSIVQGYSYGLIMDEYIKSAVNSVSLIHGLKLTKRRVGQLMNGRIDTILEDENVLKYQINSLGIDVKLKKSGCLDREGLYIAFSPKLKSSNDYIKILNKGIEVLERSGELKKIKSKYNIN